MCPFAMEADIIEKIGEKPQWISSSGSASLKIEIEYEQQSTRIAELKTIIGKPCTVKQPPYFNGKRGLIYMHSNNIKDLKNFEEELKEVCPIVDIERAPWIKTLGETRQAYSRHQTCQNEVWQLCSRACNRNLWNRL